MNARFSLLALALFACDGASSTTPPGTSSGAAAASSAAAPPNDPSGVTGSDSGTAVDAGFADTGTAPHDAGQQGVAWAAVQPIFADKCTPCHAVGNTRRRVVLTTYDTMVSVTSVQSPPMQYVTPSNLDQSFVWLKIDNTHGTPCRNLGHSSRQCGGAMPPARDPQLTSTEKNTIREWIAGGASR